MRIKNVIVFLLLLSSISLACNMSSEIYLPAVQKTDYGYTGVIARATVEVKPGTGHVFVDTFPLTQIDTQASARLARDVAFDILNKNPMKYDVFYTIRSDAPIIGGPSAGGSLTVATLSALLCINVSNDTIMTGTINPDGSIGPVGGIFEKAGASADIGARYFLIPKGQKNIVVRTQKNIQMPFGTEIVTNPVSLDIEDYAKKNWNMSVIEVSNVKDALRYMTGYELVEKKYDYTKNDKVKEIMKDVAENMINISDSKLKETKNSINNVKFSLDYINQLNELYKEAQEKNDEAKKLYNEKKYYSAASFSFAVWIKCSYINNLITFMKNDKYTLKEKLTDTENNIKKIKNEIDAKKSNIDNSEDIEIIALSEQRINDAEDYITKAWKNYYDNQFSDACYNTAYAEERARTATIWINLTDKFSGENMSFNFSSLKTLAEERLEDARSSILYAQTIIGNVNDAESTLEIAEKDYRNGDYSSSLMNSVMAKAISDIYMETRDESKDVLNEKVKEFQQQAENSISETENNGYIPLVAINYLEYGKTLNDIGSKLIYFKYASEFAKLTEDISTAMNQTNENKYNYQKVEIRKVEKENKNYNQLAIGFLIGFIFSYFILKITNKL